MRASSWAGTWKYVIPYLKKKNENGVEVLVQIYGLDSSELNCVRPETKFVVINQCYARIFHVTTCSSYSHKRTKPNVFKYIRENNLQDTLTWKNKFHFQWGFFRFLRQYT